MIAPLVALSAVASITRRGFGQIPIDWIILDLFGNIMTFDVFIVHEISLYLYINISVSYSYIGLPPRPHGTDLDCVGKR